MAGADIISKASSLTCQSPGLDDSVADIPWASIYFCMWFSLA